MIPHLRDTLSVTPAQDGRVAVTVVLPADLLGEYCRLLDALSDFFQAAKRKSVAAQAEARVASLAKDPQTERFIAAYRQRLVRSFDLYTANGLDRKEAIKRIAAELRAESHPWCSPDLVRSELVSLGRGGRPGRPRSSRSES